MTILQYLNTALVNSEIERKGLKKIWVIRELGLTRGIGYQMLNDGLLPKDVEVREKAIEKLSEILECKRTDIIIAHTEQAA